MKRFLSVVLALFIVMGTVPAMEIDADAAFVVRTSKPTDTNTYYLQTEFGGNNECGAGNGAKNGYVLPNNTGYVWGRVYEVSGEKPKLSTETADKWYSYNEANVFYGYGDKPKAGAVACWKTHVAFVESVNEDGTINVSQSHFEKKIEFEYYENMNPKEYLSGFQGYIYPLEVFDYTLYYEPEHPHNYVYTNADKDLFFANPTVKCTYSICSQCPGLSEKGYKIDNFYIPRVVKQGTDISVSGKLTSTKALRWVIGVIRDAFRNELQRDDYNYPGTTTYDLNGLNDNLDFSKLAVGEYCFMMIVQAKEISQMNNVYIPFYVTPADYCWQTEKICSPEGKLLKGEDFELSGNILSAYNITWANARILDSTKTQELQISSKAPGKAEFSISELNAGLDFSVLEPGTYYYQLKAGTASNGDMNTIETRFTILDTYEVSYDANGGSGAPASQTKVYGEGLGISSTEPVWEGHEFLGWSTEQSSSFPEYAPSTVFSKNKNTKLYAVWEHPFEQTSYTAPTCTKSGEQSFACVCGEAYTVTLSAKGHVCAQDWVTEKTESCTTSGKLTKDCLVCGVNVFTKEIPETGHSWGEKRLVAEATCTTDGKRASYCLICGEAGKEEILPATGHSYGDWITDEPATYNTPGERHKICSVCGDTVIETIPAGIEDDYSDWVLEKDAPQYAEIVDEKWVYDLQTDKQINDTDYVFKDSTFVWSDYGEWSSWSSNIKTSSESRQVETKSATYKTQYRYTRYTNSSGSGTSPWKTSAYTVINDTGWLDYKLSQYTTKSATNPNTGSYETYTVYMRDSASDLWYNESTRTIVDTPQQYRYRDRTKIYTYYYSVTSPNEITPEDATGTDVISNVQKYVRYLTRHNIKFSFTDASCDESSRLVNSGTALGKLPEATRPGYIFKGWTYTTGGTDFATANDIATKDLTLYASWELIEPESLEVSALPLKTGYCVGDELETRGLKLLVTYNDDSTKTINSGFETSYDFSTSGEKEVAVSYSEKSATVSTAFEAYVNEPARIYSDNLEVNAGETVDVPVYIENNPGISGFTIYMTYDDSVFTPVCVNDNDLSGYGMLDDNIGYSADNTVQVSWSGTENYYEDCELFTITFEVSGELDVRGDYDFDITYEPSDTFDENMNEVALECEGTTVTVINEEKPPVELGGDLIDAVAGKYVDIPVNVLNNNGLAGSNVVINYNSEVFTFVSVTNGIATVEADNSAEGELSVNLKAVKDSAEGTLFKIRFKIKDYYSGKENLIVTSSISNVFSEDIVVNITNPMADMPAEIYSDEISGNIGDTVLVPVYITNNHGMLGFKIRVTFDSTLLKPSTYCKAEAIVSGCGTVSNNISANVKKGRNYFDVIFYGDEEFSESGKMFTLKFTVQEAIPMNTSIKLDYVQADTYTEVNGVEKDVELNCNKVNFGIGGAFVSGNTVYLNKLQNASTIDLLNWIPAADGGSIENIKTNVGSFYGTGTTFDYISDDGSTEEYNVVVKGDIDGDGVIDVLDAAVAHLASNQFTELSEAQQNAADLTGDSELTVEDYSATVNLVLS